MILERADRCQMCGTAGWEWDQDPFAYHPVFVTCPGCQKKELLAADDTPRSKGTTVRLVPKRVAARLALEQQKRELVGGIPARRRRRRHR